MLRTHRPSRRSRNKSRLLKLQNLESRIALTANNDNYNVNENAVLNVAAPGVLANDTGAGPRFVIGNTSPTTSGVPVTVNADGSFTYNMGAAFESLGQGQIANDTFQYTMINVGANPDATAWLAPTGPNGTYHAYVRVPTALTWDQARAFALTQTANGVQGHLATVTSYYENQHVLQMRNSLGGTDVWLGGNDKGPGITSLLDGAIVAPGGTEGGNSSGNGPNILGQVPQAGQRGFGWVWSNGEPMIYSNWAGGEPNGGTGESAMQLRNDGLWNDLPAGNTFSAANEGTSALPSIIEFDLNLTLAQLNTIRSTGFNVTTMGAYNGGFTNDINSGRNPWGSYIRHADAIINGPQAVGFPAQVVHALADVSDAGASSQFAGGTQLAGVNNVDQYVSVTTGILNVTVAGNYTFAFAADDGGRLKIDVDGNGQLEDVLITDTLATTVEMQHSIFLSAGQHAFNWMWFENGGGAFGELGYRQGTGPVGFNSANYKLVGDGSGGIGTVGNLTTTTYRANQGNFGLNNIADATSLLNGGIPRGVDTFRAITPVINFQQSGGAGQYGGDRAVPGYLPPGTAANGGNGDEQYAMLITGFIYIPSAGDWTFNFNSDDGFNMGFGARVGGGGTATLEAAPVNANNNAGNMEFPNGRGAADSLGSWNFTSAGFYPVTIRTWEGGGGSAFEFSSAQGNQDGFNAALFDLVGDTANGGLAVVANMVGETATVTIAVTGQNDAPTAVVNGPYAVTEGQNLNVTAAGSTDIDTNPPTVLSYSWDLNGDGVFGDFVSPTAAASIPWNTLQALNPPVNNGPGVINNVRVRVSDGIATTTSAATTITVANAAPTAGVAAGTNVAVPGQPIAFTFTGNDPSNLGTGNDQSAGFTFTINYGDGPPVVVGPGQASPLVQNHVYATTGVKNITVTATDQNGATSVVAQTSVTITNVVQLPNGDVVVGGTDSADTITFSKGSGTNLNLRIVTGGVTTNYGPTPVPANARLIVFGRGGADTISTSSVPQIAEIYGGDDADYITGGTNNDTLSGEGGNDRILGGAGLDTIDGGSENDSIDAGAGDDTVNGGSGVDTVNGGDGNDVLDGGDGNDTVNGGNGNDILRGGSDAGADTMNGGAGHDFLLGGDGSDKLAGDAGNDILIGGIGADNLNGGADSDLIIDGTTDQDAAADMVQQALLAAWASMNDYSGFVITNDGQVDTMLGSTGADHFFGTGFFDKTTDFSTSQGDLLN